MNGKTTTNLRVDWLTKLTFIAMVIAVSQGLNAIASAIEMNSRNQSMQVHLDHGSPLRVRVDRIPEIKVISEQN